MKHLLQLNNKHGVSLLISYVLLITISVALSILVYNWLRFYVQDSDAKNCKEGVTLSIQDYECLLADGGSLNLTLKNKGRFNVDGFVLKVHDRPGADIGLYNFTNEGVALAPAQVYNHKYRFEEVDMNTSALQIITLLEVQPFVMENQEKIFCEKISSQSIECS